jgi:hypothetical protein
MAIRLNDASDEDRPKSVRHHIELTPRSAAYRLAFTLRRVSHSLSIRWSKGLTAEKLQRKPPWAVFFARIFPIVAAVLISIWLLRLLGWPYWAMGFAIVGMIASVVIGRRSGR